jgi:hypothetical protein
MFEREILAILRTVSEILGIKGFYTPYPNIFPNLACYVLCFSLVLW